MNYYERRQLQDREARGIGAGIALILMSPGFGIIAGAFLSSATAMYVTTGIVALLGILSLAGAIREKIEQNKNLNN